MKKLSLIFAACLLIFAVAAPVARAEWPDRPIRFIVGFGPGGANDLIARFAAEGIGKQLKQTVVVENRPGAGAVIGTAYVAHSAPDGYTFLVGAANTITNSLLLKDLPYKDEDLVPVGMIAVAPSTIIVNPSVPANNMKEFIAWAKAQGGKGVTWATAGNGSTPEFVGRDAQGSNRHLPRHRPLQERRRGRERRPVEQCFGDLGSEHRRDPQDQGGAVEGDRDDLHPAHQRLSFHSDHGGTGLPDGADRPLGGPLCAARHAGGGHRAHERRAAGGAQERRGAQQADPDRHRAGRRIGRRILSNSPRPNASGSAIWRPT